MTAIIRPRAKLTQQIDDLIIGLQEWMHEAGEPPSDEAAQQFDAAIARMEAVRDDVCNVPLALLQVTEQYMIAEPATYDRLALHAAREIGDGIELATATEYVTRLNELLALNRFNFV